MVHTKAVISGAKNKIEKMLGIEPFVLHKRKILGKNNKAYGVFFCKIRLKCPSLTQLLPSLENVNSDKFHKRKYTRTEMSI